VSVEELGVPAAMTVGGLVGFLFEEVLVFTGAAEHATVALTGIQESIFLHDGLEVDAEVYVFLHRFLILGFNNHFLLQRKRDLIGYTETLGILHENLDLMPFEQVAVHAGVVAVSLFGLLHHEMQLNGRVGASVVDIVL
jgi:hypothetical protein